MESTKGSFRSSSEDSNRWWPVVTAWLCAVYLSLDIKSYLLMLGVLGILGSKYLTSGGGPGWSGCLGSIIRDVSNYTLGFQPPLKLPGRRTFTEGTTGPLVGVPAEIGSGAKLMASSQRKISVRQGSVVHWRTAASTSKCLHGCGLRWSRKGWQWSTRRGRTTVAATATNPARGPEASIHAIDSDITGA